MRTPFLIRLYQRFIRIRGNPREIALGLALGLFIGFSPTMGAQIAMAVFLASFLKWNKFAAGIGVPAAVVGYVFCYAVVDRYQERVKARLICQKEALKLKMIHRKNIRKKKKASGRR